MIRHNWMLTENPEGPVCLYGGNRSFIYSLYRPIATMTSVHVLIGHYDTGVVQLSASHKRTQLHTELQYLSWKLISLAFSYVWSCYFCTFKQELRKFLLEFKTLQFTCCVPEIQTVRTIKM